MAKWWLCFICGKHVTVNDDRLHLCRKNGTRTLCIMCSELWHLREAIRQMKKVEKEFGRKRG